MTQGQIAVGSGLDDCRVGKQKKRSLCAEFCSSRAVEQAN